MDLKRSESGLSVCRKKIAAGPRQHSQSWFLVPSVPITFTCFETMFYLRREEEFDYYWSLLPYRGVTRAGTSSLNGPLLHTHTHVRTHTHTHTHTHIYIYIYIYIYSVYCTHSTVRLSGKLLDLANTVIVGSESHGTHDHILLSLTRAVARPWPI
jgi:hypothetical protein